jgi:SAM-dependent methyltransferase
LAESEHWKRSCPACQSGSSIDRGRKNGFQLLSCEKCGTVYTRELPGLSSAQDYDGYYTDANLSVPEFIHRRLDEIVADFGRYRQGNRLLEIGFGAGTFLQAAQRAGWNAEGVEVSKTAADHGSAEGLKTFCGDLADAHYDDGSFDVVIASELLEHVPSPKVMIREVARIVRSGGLFWATTPNSKGVSARLLGMEWSIVSPPEHLHLFSEDGLRGLLLSEGFRSCDVRTEGINPVELLSRLRRQEDNNGQKLSADIDRVSTGYQLNEALLKSRSRRAVKNLMNGLLRLSHLGDSLKIRAER